MEMILSSILCNNLFFLSVDTRVHAIVPRIWAGFAGARGRDKGLAQVVGDGVVAPGGPKVAVCSVGWGGREYNQCDIISAPWYSSRPYEVNCCAGWAGWAA